MDIQKIFERQAQIEEGAWDVFIADYERKNPPPERPNKENDLIHIGMWFGLASALFLSGLFTVPTFQKLLATVNIHPGLQFIGGVCAFIAVDVVMFISGYYLVKEHYRPMVLRGHMDSHELSKWMTVAFVFGFSVSVATNAIPITEGYQVFDSSGNRGLNLIVAFLTIFAPAIQVAATSGIIAIMPLGNMLAVQAWREDMDSWKDSRNRSWASYRSKYNRDKAISRLENVSNHMSNGRTNGHYVSDASESVWTHLKRNPEDVSLSVRDLARKIGVSKSTVSNVRQKMYENGELDANKR